MKRSKRKQEIYQVSAKLFRKKGYTASTMREIAEIVGLEPSSLYSHIKSKEEILIDICNDCAELFAEGMARIIADKESPQTKLNALIDLHIDMAYNRPSSITVFNDEWKHLPQPQLESFLIMRKEYEDHFKSILKDGMRSGDFDSISATTALNIIINSAKWLHFHSKKFDKKEFDLKRNEIKGFIQKGLKSN